MRTISIEPALISTGEVSRRMGPGVNLTVKDVAAMGFTPQAQPGAGTWWLASDFPAMCDHLVAQIAKAKAAAQPAA